MVIVYVTVPPRDAQFLYVGLRNTTKLLTYRITIFDIVYFSFARLNVGLSLSFVSLLGMGKGDDYKDDSIDIYAYFNSSCYSGFFDDDDVCTIKHCQIVLFIIGLLYQALYMYGRQAHTDTETCYIFDKLKLESMLMCSYKGFIQCHRAHYGLQNAS